jgi:molecular chaperone DnaK
MTDKVDNSVIRIGIDLGTTNSEIAIYKKDQVEIIKNSLGDYYTPSVFGIDKAGNKIVGKKAYDKLFKGSSNEEFENNKSEIKRLMGTGDKIRFSRSKETFTPEAISAEILKSLKENLERKYPDQPTNAAVITVPAYFDSLQAEATKRAGKLAGFEYVVLVQEPIAAAISYGFDNAVEENWLVFDFGGGTFDVALISSKEGMLKVLEHGGDNFLGGKDIDQKLVDEVIKPSILEQFEITNFNYDNPKYKSVFAKLKSIAETAKIELSQYDKTMIEIDGVGLDDNGEDIYVSLSYLRSDFEDLIKPIIDKTIVASEKVIEQSKVSKDSISKVVFVGGPTQIPYLRERVQEELGIEIDTSADPLTTVARGACIYGLSQRIPENITDEFRKSESFDKMQVTLHYDSMTSDEDQMITGSVDLKVPGEYYLKINSESGFYESANITLKNGKFKDTLALEKNQANVFQIYLYDKNGNSLPVFPEVFTITHGLTVQGTPIPHDVGVVYAKKGFDPLEDKLSYADTSDRFFSRNSILPLKGTKSYKTVRELEKGIDNALPIKVYEGDSDNPARNTTITTLKIDGKQMKYNLPEGSDIDITIQINESREVSVEAYLPIIDLTLNARVDDYAQPLDQAQLKMNSESLLQRIVQMGNVLDDEERKAMLDEFGLVVSSIQNAHDEDSLRKAERDLRALSQQVDEIEDSKTIDKFALRFHELVNKAQILLEGLENDDVRTILTTQFRFAQSEGIEAIENQDQNLLFRAIGQLKIVVQQSILENQAVWKMYFDELKDKDLDQFSDPKSASRYIQRAEMALGTANPQEFRNSVIDLIHLLPKEEQDEMNTAISGITK